MKTRKLILIVGGAFIGGLFGAYHEITWYGAILSVLLFAYNGALAGLLFDEMVVNTTINLYHSVVDLRTEESLEFLKAGTTNPPAYRDAVSKQDNVDPAAIDLDIINPTKQT